MAGAAKDRLTGYPPNPAYGTGVCRRRFGFVASPGRMTVSLYDDFHDMIVEIDHDGSVVTATAGAMRRFPKDTCPGAVALLQQFIGCDVTQGRSAIAGRFSRGAHCTHLIDMAALGLSAIQRGVADQTVELSVTDPDADHRQSLIVKVDGEVALSLELQGEAMVAPAQYAGRSLFGGFSRWADEQFTGFERDLWQMAQMMLFISHGRKFIVDGTTRIAARDEPHRKGNCFSYSDPAFQTALDMVGFFRDHTEGLPPRDREGERTGREGS
ncbi:MAG: DUF2889 domain-containing protein [Novosphingobium sp.]|nr:DUF2889 domain-containing protein [Novosphingobium sp.]